MSCLARALRLLAARDLTEHQLRAKLTARGHSPSEVQAVVERLRAGGMLDDHRLAYARARNEAQRGRKGPHRVRRELQEAGIPDPVARQAVSEAFAEVDQLECLDAVLGKRLGGGAIRTDAEFKKLFAFLLRRGFEAADIMTALRRRSRRPEEP